ncbi:MAG: type II secretion system F family protein [Candidatus Gastranaerophilales bacterium]|nr:type II secretion system F family protein [Candidatus Gastranaerophilales bacterium]
MTTFFFRCKLDGGIKEGYIDANSAKHASDKLESKGYIVLELKEQVKIASSKTTLKQEIKPLDLKEKKDFYSSFNRQYKSSIAFYEIFNNIMATASTNNIKTLCFNIVQKLQKDTSFEDVFSYYSNYLGKTEAALIVAGEKTGKLENTLEKISKLVSEQEELISTLTSKATYPCIIFVLLLFACSVFAFFVFPIFNATIEGQDVNIKTVLVPALVKIAITFAIVGLIVWKIKTSRNIQNGFISKIFKLNFIETILKKYQISNFFLTFSLAYDAGVSPVQSLELSCNLIKNEHIKKRIEKVHQMLQQGCEITTAFNVADVFDEYSISQITTGEKSGELAKAFEEISLNYKKDYMARIDALLKLVEPLMLGIGAIFILVLAVKMISKYYDTLFSLF